MRKNRIKLVERIARVLCSADGNSENTQFEGRPMWVSYLPTAKAVLVALRPVSLKMIAAANGEPGDKPDAGMVWTRIINHAIEEVEEHGKP